MSGLGRRVRGWVRDQPGDQIGDRLRIRIRSRLKSRLSVGLEDLLWYLGPDLWRARLWGLP